MTLAIVPVKRLADTKSRLLAHLDAPQREAFALAMLQDVIGALLGASSIKRTVVVTPDDFFGSISGDLASRRSQIVETELRRHVRL